MSDKKSDDKDKSQRGGKSSNMSIVFVGILIIAILSGLNTEKKSRVVTDDDTNNQITTPQSKTSTKKKDSSIQSVDSYTREQKPPLSAEDIEKKLARVYKDLDKLEEKVRIQMLKEPESPYQSMVVFKKSNARSKNPDTEYLTLTASSKNAQDLPISDWYIESYVTEARAALPDGMRILTLGRLSAKKPIFLKPGEKAYITTGESPASSSFHENLCTGYLRTEGDFNPSLKRSCPSALDEMEKYGNIALDNDTCYDFVKRINRCEVIDEDIIEIADISKGCKNFVQNTLNYNSCVEVHRFDPFFDKNGSWRIYLDRDEELWRYEREIIRLIDENDKIISVIEY